MRRFVLACGYVGFFAALFAIGVAETLPGLIGAIFASLFAMLAVMAYDAHSRPARRGGAE